ncbi:hypothetical protein ACLM5J_10975 [Nocardioides sp. Bht2]|uniref:hypothetical protein n=1 Tax=Nocardioides sp. Bht2 TaxID=3392297 RepID=UPI0039B6D8F8
MASSGLRGTVRAFAILSVAVTVGAGVAAGVVQATEAPATSEPGAAKVELGTNPFVGTFDADYYVNWAIQSGTATGEGKPASYRVPLSWTVKSTSTELVATDDAGVTVARGHAPSYYFGNNCRNGAGTEVPAAWTVLADPVPGTDLEAASTSAVETWVRTVARNADGVDAPLTSIESTPVTLNDGTAAVRSRVRVDLTVFNGPCLADQAELAATTIATDEGAVSLIQSRYLLSERAVGDRVWAGIAASLRAPD